MDSLDIRDGTEELGDAIIDLLTDNLEEAIDFINTKKADGIDITMPGTILLEDPDLGFTLLDMDQFPALFVFADKELDTPPKEAIQLKVTGFLRDDNTNNLHRKNIRFAQSVKATLKRQMKFNGKANGGLIGKVDYLPQLANNDCFYAGFIIEAAYYKIIN